MGEVVVGSQALSTSREGKAGDSAKASVGITDESGGICMCC
jgi:hypothetical protein